MNKQEFLREIAAKAGLTIKDAGAFYEAYVATVKEQLKKGNKIVLVGFGTFSSRKRAARTAINPRTKAKVQVKACVVPALKFGKAFKEEFAKKK